MARQVRTLTTAEKQACLSVLEAFGYASVSQAEAALGLTVGTFRDRLCAEANRHTSATEVLEHLLLHGVRRTHRSGSAARALAVAEAATSGQIKCRTCKRIRPLEDFKYHKDSLGGRHQRCIDCEALRMRCDRYDLEPEDIYALWNAQRGRCGLCRKPLKPEYMNAAGVCFVARTSEADAAHVDHEHRALRTGETHKNLVRGLLCSDCNRGLKSTVVADPERWVASAIAWLSRPTGLAWERIGPVPSPYLPEPLHGKLARRQYLKYGITALDKEKLRTIQGRCCGICDTALTPGRLEHLDHDQGAPKFAYVVSNVARQRAQLRGLLCASCNTALPRFGHDIAVLRLVAGYLNDPPAKRLWLE